MKGVRAVIAGVESYEAEGWELDGPASDAVRMASHLLDQGLAADQITLLIAPLAANAARVARLGLPVRRPDHQTVYDLVTKELRQDRAESLLFFWGGHGVVDGDGNRRLFYSDATAHDKRNLDFNSLYEALNTGYYQGLNHQLFVVDACQNLTEELRYLNRLPHQVFPRGLVAPNKKQHALFAARPGQRAVNLNDNKTGLFSAAVLAYFKQQPSWPPDVPAMSAVLDAQFTGMRMAGDTDQAPAYLWRDTDGVESLVFAAPPRQAAGQLTLDQLVELKDALLKVPEVVDATTRQTMIMFMPLEISAAVKHSSSTHIHVVSWIQACERFLTGRSAFVGALRLGISNQEELGRLLTGIDRVWPP